jgi:cyclophilin family peptidyl-prolyl cis-trans isomerase
MRFHARVVRSLAAIFLAIGLIGLADAQQPTPKDAKTPPAKDAAKKDAAKDTAKSNAEKSSPPKKDAAKAPAAKGKAAADQPPPTAPPATSPAAAAPAGAEASRPAAAQYHQALEDWKTVLKDLRKLKLQYQSAAAGADQAKIQQEWKDLIAKGNDIVSSLEAAGIKAYVESPNEDAELSRFLVKLADDAIQRDDYAAAKRLTDVLIEYQCPDKQIYDSAAIAAFVLNDYDTAEKYFKQAKDLGVQSDTSKQLEPLVKQYREFWEKEKQTREAEAKADDLPRVKLTTTKGDIVLELFENEAPETVGNFVSLVEKGFYNNLNFHRVLKGFMAQGGDPKGDGTGGPEYRIFGEQSRPNHRNHFQGSLSMAHTGDPDTGGSQFFITFRQTPHLNGLHTCFGRVIEGMDVLPKLQRRDPQAPNAPAPDSIIKAEVLRKRDHVYQPHKVE